MDGDLVDFESLPALVIKDKRIWFNGSAYDKMGDPAFLRLLWNKDYLLVFVPTDEDSAPSALYELEETSKGPFSAWNIWAPDFTLWYQQRFGEGLHYYWVKFDADNRAYIKLGDFVSLDNDGSP